MCWIQFETGAENVVLAQRSLPLMDFGYVMNGLANAAYTVM